MNQRIRELANEAAKFSAIMALPTGEAGDNLFVEKFAELIVKECLDILDDEDTHDVYGQPIRLATIRIKKLFGVAK